MSKYEYRLVKSSWGIAIDVIGEHKFFNGTPDSGKFVCDGIWLDFRVSNINLSQLERDLVFKGIELAGNELLKVFKLPDYILFVISEINFSDCDYQKEGLVIAVWGWANQEFDFPPPTINSTFDKTNNKYVLSW